MACGHSGNIANCKTSNCWDQSLQHFKSLRQLSGDSKCAHTQANWESCMKIRIKGSVPHYVHDPAVPLLSPSGITTTDENFTCTKDSDRVYNQAGAMTYLVAQCVKHGLSYGFILVKDESAECKYILKKCKLTTAETWFSATKLLRHSSDLPHTSRLVTHFTNMRWMNLLGSTAPPTETTAAPSKSSK